MRIREESFRLGEGRPSEPVDLLARLERPAVLRHRPVPNHFGASVAVGVGDSPEVGPEPAPHPGLLHDFTQGGRLLELAVEELAFWEAPVVVTRPVNERDAPLLPVAPHDDASGRADDAIAAHAQKRSLFRESAPQTAGNASRAARASSASMDASCPATNARDGDAIAASRNHREATTASWCSPRAS